MEQKFKSKERVSSAKKNANKKEWYKERADLLDGYGMELYTDGASGVSEYKKMQVNYDLFNNILNLSDFEYVCAPYGAKVGELPATMVNRDISSGPIKTMLGMELKRAFSWTLVATNPEATSRREQEEFGQFKEFVLSEALKPIRQKIELEKAQQAQGRELTPDEQQAIAQEIEQEMQARTPEHIKKYMQREYQDPAELQGIHLIKYLTQKCDLQRKFNNVYKHGLLSGKEIVYVGQFNGEPDAWEINPKRFNHDRSPDVQFIEKGEWATYSHRMKPSQIVSLFRNELTEEEIDRIYSSWSSHYNANFDADLFAVDERNKDYATNSSIEVVHTVWKGLRKIGFLTYMDEATGEPREMLVDETYKLNEEAGDIQVEFEWLPEVYETWKIKVADPIYVKMQPLPGQFRDMDNLGECDLPYYGICYDSMNSETTSLMDRLKVFQYYYNIVMYRLELLIASDKGKKVLMNVGAIPTSAGIDIEKWQYYFEATPFMYYDPQEEGSSYQDANTVAKVIDLSLVSDIQKYIEIAEYLRKQAGQSVGITDTVLGQIGAREAVSNTQQSLIQSSHILEMYFEMHNYVKRNVIKALLECAKVAYAESKPRKLSYVLDDMGIQMFDLDINLLDSSTLGLFVENSIKVEEAKEFIKQLAHAAMQTQKAELSDIVSIIRQDSIIESEETLKVAEERRREQDNAANQQNIEAQAEQAEKAREFERERMDHDINLAIIKEEERRKTIVAGNAIQGMSFNPDADADGDGVNDFLEIARYGVDAEVKRSKIQLEKEALEHRKNYDNEKLKNEKQKLSNDKEKIKIAKKKSNSL